MTLLELLKNIEQGTEMLCPCCGNCIEIHPHDKECELYLLMAGIQLGEIKTIETDKDLFT